jgi:hypothetical protein
MIAQGARGAVLARGVGGWLLAGHGTLELATRLSALPHPLRSAGSVPVTRIASYRAEMKYRGESKLQRNAPSRSRLYQKCFLMIFMSASLSFLWARATLRCPRRSSFSKRFSLALEPNIWVSFPFFMTIW